MDVCRNHGNTKSKLHALLNLYGPAMSMSGTLQQSAFSIWLQAKKWLEQEIKMNSTVFFNIHMIIWGTKIPFRNLFRNANTWAYQAPQSMGILQASIRVWVAILFSRESSQHRNWTGVSALWAVSLLVELLGKPLIKCLGFINLDKVNTTYVSMCTQSL